MLTRDTIVQLLQREQAYLAAEFGVSRVGLFGSYANGQPDETSDIDLLVEFKGPIGFRFLDFFSSRRYPCRDRSRSLNR